jgi:hypothetical protein
MDDDSKPVAVLQVASGGQAVRRTADEQNGIIQHQLLLSAQQPRTSASRRKNADMSRQQEKQNEHFSYRVVDDDTSEREIVALPESHEHLRRSTRLANQQSEQTSAAIAIRQEPPIVATTTDLRERHVHEYQGGKVAQILPGISSTATIISAANFPLLLNNQLPSDFFWNAASVLREPSPEEEYEALHHDVDSILSEALLPTVFETDYEGPELSSTHDHLTPLELHPSENELGQLTTSRKIKSHEEWYSRVRELVVFQDKNGHMNVPQLYAQNKKLGNWVNKQRGAPRERLSPKQFEILQRVGFDWGRKKGEIFWNKKMLELEAYKAEHGNCKYKGTGTGKGQLSYGIPSHHRALRINLLTRCD